MSLVEVELTGHRGRTATGSGIQRHSPSCQEGAVRQRRLGQLCGLRTHIVLPPSGRYLVSDYNSTSLGDYFTLECVR